MPKNGDVRIVEQHGEFSIEHYSEAWGDESAEWFCKIGDWGFKTLEAAISKANEIYNSIN